MKETYYLNQETLPQMPVPHDNQIKRITVDKEFITFFLTAKDYPDDGIRVYHPEAKALTMRFHLTYEDDFPKYRKKIEPTLLRLTMRSVAVQATKKFVYSAIGGNYKAAETKKALDMLTKAGIVIPVTHSNANGLPLGSEVDSSYQKMLLLDTGLMLRLLNMTTGDISELTEHILTSDVSDLVNKGPMAEMIAGLELLHYRTPNIRHELYYWQRHAKNSQAEVDYISSYRQTVLPIEVKAEKQGGMKSLWMFMREKKITNAIRCSLENFGAFDYEDNKDGGTLRHVHICPLYAISQMDGVLKKVFYPPTYPLKNQT